MHFVSAAFSRYKWCDGPRRKTRLLDVSLARVHVWSYLESIEDGEKTERDIVGNVIEAIAEDQTTAHSHIAHIPRLVRIRRWWTRIRVASMPGRCCQYNHNRTNKHSSLRSDDNSRSRYRQVFHFLTFRLRSDTCQRRLHVVEPAIELCV